VHCSLPPLEFNHHHNHPLHTPRFRCMCSTHSTQLALYRITSRDSSILPTGVSLFLILAACICSY